jgi:hypothetical protein
MYKPSPALCATQKFLMYVWPIKISNQENKDANFSLWIQCRFFTVRMLEWREREHEDNDYFVENDPVMVNALP